MIRLVLADDESLTRGAVGALLGLEADLQVVGEAGTGDEAVAAVQQHRPDVAVLDSAGVALVVRGDPTTLGPTSRNVLGRVLREAMTNVLRHAQPSHCTILIEVDRDGARLEVVNDGALPPGDGSGTGLAALDRYLREHAGRLDAGPTEDGRFRVDARLPAGVR